MDGGAEDTVSHHGDMDDDSYSKLYRYIIIVFNKY